MVDYELGYLRSQQKKTRQLLISFIIIVLALVILIAWVYFMWLAPVSEPAIINQDTSTDIERSNVALPVQTQPVSRPLTPVNPTESELKRLSASFTENYGTYSNQAGYQNIKDLQVFMSQDMQVRSRDFINDAINEDSNNNIYYGITTTAVVVNTQRFDETRSVAEFLVKTQRVESVGTPNNQRQFQQEAVIRMIKESGVWKVDRIVWQE